MSSSWEYANHVQRVQKHGGPAAYDRALREVGYNAGYVDGKTEGVHKGILYMLPLVLVSCGYLAYEKLPVLWHKIKTRIYYTTKLEMLEEERHSKGKHLNLEPICPICGKKAFGIDEVIKLFGFDRAYDGNLIQREVCQECSSKSNN